MGEVWLAYDEELGDRPVAIKVMRSRVLADDGHLARFQREMRLTSRMQHPNIMTVFTTGSDGGVPFMVMEYLQGGDLSQLAPGGGPDEVAQIGRETCLALSYAHGLDPGVVHRDIKPGNLFICDAGTVKVTDFGLAKAVTETGLSTAGSVYGTLAYISPEQWLGAPVTFSDDIWSLGCVLYELLSGKLPRSYRTPADYLAAAARREPVAPLPDTVPAALAEAVMAMLDTDPLRRPTAVQAGQLLSPRRARPVAVPGASPWTPAPAPESPARQEMPPTRREMTLAGLPWPDAAGPTRQERPLPGRLSGAGAPVIPAQGPPEMSQAGVAAEGPGAGALVTGTRKRRRLLVPVIAGTAAAAAAIYGSVSALTGPSPGHRAGEGPGVRTAATPGTGGAPVTSTPPADPAAAKEIAYKMLPAFGFNQTTQYSCLLILWDKISGWNVFAGNESGGYGIPQATPGNMMAAAGADWQTSAATQVKWGLGYIKETYGTPCGARQYEESNGSY